jgi:hypothetical protein
MEILDEALQVMVVQLCGFEDENACKKWDLSTWLWDLRSWALWTWNWSKKGGNEALDVKQSSSIPLIPRLVRCGNTEASESIPATSKQRFRSMARDLLSGFSAVAWSITESRPALGPVTPQMPRHSACIKNPILLTLWNWPSVMILAFAVTRQILYLTARVPTLKQIRLSLCASGVRCRSSPGGQWSILLRHRGISSKDGAFQGQ